MAPPVPTLPEIAGTLALSFTSAASDGPAEGPNLQRPSVPTPATSTAEPEPPATAEPSGPKPPTLPSFPGESAPATDESLPEPTAAAPDAGDPTAPLEAPPADVVDDFGDPSPTAEVEPGPYDLPEPDPGPKPSTGLLAPTEKRFFFDLFVGGMRTLRGGYSYGYFSSTDFKIEGTLGGHSKRWPTLGGAAVLQTSFGLLNTITLGPRMQWDKPLVKTHALFSTTQLMLAYRAAVIGYYGLIGGLREGAYHSALFGVGWGVRAIVADRLSLTFRPVNVSLAGPAPGIVQIDWDVFGGIGVVW